MQIENQREKHKHRAIKVERERQTNSANINNEKWRETKKRRDGRRQKEK